MTDPYAAYGGQTDPTAGAPPPDPYAAYGGQTDPTTATTQPAQPTPIDPTMQRLNRSAAQGAGFLKGMAHTVAGIGELEASPLGMAVFPGSAIGRQQTLDAAKWLRAHTVINGPDEARGNLAETVSEFLALPAGEKLAEAPEAIANLYGKGQQVAKFLADNPKALTLMRLGLNSIQSGGEQAAQEYLKTQDPQAALRAGEYGTAISGVLGAAGAGVRGAWNAGREALSDFASRMTPVDVPIAGVDVPTVEGRMRIVEGQQRDATRLAEQIDSNLGQRAVVNSLDAANAARPVGRGTPPNPSLLLPAEASAGGMPEARPDQFTTQGTTAQFEPPHEPMRPIMEPNPDFTPLTDERGVPTDAGMAQRATQGEAPATPIRSFTGDTQRLNYYQPPQSTGVTIPRGAPMIFTADGTAMPIDKARYTLNNYQAQLDSAISPRARVAVQAAYDDISGQVNRYDNYMANQMDLYRNAAQTRSGMYEDFAASEPNFPVHDSQGIAANTNGLLDAGQNIMDAHRPFFITADRLTGGQFGPLAKRANGLQKIISSPDLSSADRLARLDDLQQVNNDISNLFDANRTRFTPAEWRIAKQGFTDGSALNELGSFLEGHMNGITRADASADSYLDANRIFDPGGQFTEGLQKIYNARGPVLERTIGADGMRDLKKMGLLFENADTVDAANSLSQSIRASIMRHFQGLRGLIGSGVGGTLGTQMGIHLAGHAISGGLGGGMLGLASPAVIGGSIEGTRKFIADKIISDPAFRSRFIYSVQNKIPPRQAGPILAARIIGALTRPTPLTEQAAP